MSDKSEKDSDCESDKEEANLKWCHFLMDGSTRVDVPANFIEGYDDTMELELNEQYNVFWSPNEEDTPQSIQNSPDRGPIVAISKLAKKPKVPIMGWYPSLLLAVGDSYEELENMLDRKRVRKPTSKALSQESSRRSHPKQSPEEKDLKKTKKSKESGGTTKKLKEAMSSAKRQNVLAIMKSFGADVSELELKQPSSLQKSTRKGNKIGVPDEDNNRTLEKKGTIEGTGKEPSVKAREDNKEEKEIFQDDDGADMQKSEDEAEEVKGTAEDEGPQDDGYSLMKEQVVMKATPANRQEDKNLDKDVQKKKINVCQNGNKKESLEEMEENLTDDVDSDGTSSEVSSDDSDSDVPESVHKELKMKYSEKCEQLVKLEAQFLRLQKHNKTLLKEKEELDKCIKTKEHEMEKALKMKDQEMGEALRKKAQEMENVLKIKDQKYAGVVELNINLQLELARLKSQVSRDDLSSLRRKDDSFVPPHKSKKKGDSSVLMKTELSPIHKAKSSPGGEKSLSPSFLGKAKPLTSTPRAPFEVDLAFDDNSVDSDECPSKVSNLHKRSSSSSTSPPKKAKLQVDTSKGSKETKKRKRDHIEAPEAESSSMMRSESELRETLSEPAFAFSEQQIDELLKLFKKKSGSSYDSKFVKKAATMMWSDKQLWNRSASGMGSTNRKEHSVRPECTPQKKDYLKELLQLKLSKEKNPDPPEKMQARLDKVPTYLSSKISQLRKLPEPPSPSQKSSEDE